MSYVLIRGKRYYRDDSTGKMVLDNVSQAVAEQRERQNQDTHLTQRSIQSLRDSQRNHQSVNSSEVSVISNSVLNLAELFRGMVRTTRISVIVGSVILFLAYCVHDQAQIQNPFHLPEIHTAIHFQMRDANDMRGRMEQVGGQMIKLISYEGRRRE